MLERRYFEGGTVARSGVVPRGEPLESRLMAVGSHIRRVIGKKGLCSIDFVTAGCRSDVHIEACQIECDSYRDSSIELGDVGRILWPKSGVPELCGVGTDQVTSRDQRQRFSLHRAGRSKQPASSSAHPRRAISHCPANPGSTSFCARRTDHEKHWRDDRWTSLHRQHAINAYPHPHAHAPSPLIFVAPPRRAQTREFTSRTHILAHHTRPSDTLRPTRAGQHHTRSHHHQPNSG